MYTHEEMYGAPMTVVDLQHLLATDKGIHRVKMPMNTDLHPHGGVFWGVVSKVRVREILRWWEKSQPSDREIFFVLSLTEMISVL
jgi:hypothetical protein